MITRFNPTANGPIHLGHLYNLLVCYAEADKVALRFDDNQTYWVKLLGHKKMREIAEQQLYDLNWMGFKFSDICYQSKMEEIVLRRLATSPHWRMVPEHWASDPSTYPIIISEPPIEAFGSYFFIAAEKVILDYVMNTDLLVRGLEFLQENALYSYFCGVFGFPIPKMIYVQRLMTHGGSELSDISKTLGNWRIEDLRNAGISQRDIMTVLRDSCLKNPSGSFGISNLKGAPELSVSSIEEMAYNMTK